MLPAVSAAMTPQELQERTLVFSLRTYQFIKPLLSSLETRHIAVQLLRSATSVAANYRAACLARSSKEWLAKLGVIREEADESVLWLVFIQRGGMAQAAATELDDLLGEARELTRIFVASYRTSKENRRRGSVIEP